MIEFKLLGIGILTWMVFLPVLGMIAVLFVPKSAEKSIKYIAVGFTFFALNPRCSYCLLFTIRQKQGLTTLAGFQFVEKITWIDVPAFIWDGRLKVEYFMGVDGISFPMVLLTALISFIGAIASFSVKRNEKGYYMMYLFLVTGMMGVFVSLDLFLFFVFWEIMLLPMYFLIGIWGGERREYAAIKFFLYTLFGSAFILLVMIGSVISVQKTRQQDCILST